VRPASSAANGLVWKPPAWTVGRMFTTQKLANARTKPRIPIKLISECEPMETHQQDLIDRKGWIDPLNALAGRTLVQVSTCQDRSRAYPASSRQRGLRCSACWQQARCR